MTILQNDPELIDWVLHLDTMGAGNFLRAVGQAALHADQENYPLMRPLLLVLKHRYPKYDQPRAEKGKSA